MKLQKNSLYIYFIFFYISYILYPVWFVPTKKISLQCSILFFLVIYFLIHLLFLKKNLEYNKYYLNIQFINPGYFYIVCSLIGFILLIIRSNLPIAPIGDEHVLSLSGIGFFMMINKKLGMSIPLIRTSFIILFLILFTFLYVYFKILKNAKKINIFLFIFFILISFLYFYIFTKSFSIENTAVMKMIFRYPALNKLIFLISNVILSTNEIATRMPSVISALLTSYFIFLILSEFIEKQKSEIISAIYLFIPIIQYYGAKAYLDSMGNLFFTVQFFLFLKFLQKKDKRYLFFLGIFSGIFFLIRRPPLINFVFITVFFFLYDLKDIDISENIFKNLIIYFIDKFKVFFLTLYWGYSLIIPRMIIAKFASEYEVGVLGNFKGFDFLLYFFTTAAPKFFSLYGSVLIPILLIFAIILYKKDAFIHFLIFFICSFYFYLFQEPGFKHMRLWVPFFIVIFLLSCLVLEKISVFYVRIISVFIILYFLFINFSPYTFGIRPKHNYFYEKQHFLFDYNTAYKYIKKNIINIHPDIKIYSPGVTEPSHYYAFINSINFDKNFNRKIWKKVGKQNINNLFYFCKKNNFNYILLPFWDKNFQDHKFWNNLFLNLNIIEELKNKPSMFKKIKEFPFGKNTLLLYKIKK